MEINMSIARRGRNDSHNKSGSDVDTRHPTTDKKLQSTPAGLRRCSAPPDKCFSRSQPPRLLNPLHGGQMRSLPEEISRLERREAELVSLGHYRRAETVHERLGRAQSQLISKRQSSLAAQQKQERKAISCAHRRQVDYLHVVWQDYFGQLRTRQDSILRSFQRDQQRQTAKDELLLQRRCRSVRTSSPQLIELQSRERRLLQRGRSGKRESEDYRYLSWLRQLLQRAAEQERQRRARLAEELAQAEHQRMALERSRKYAVLVGRLEEYRRDKERVYLREQKRLRQKYKNVLQQLRHEQAVELEELARLTLP